MYETEKKILGLRASYCKFMNIENLPYFKIKTFRNSKSTDAYIEYSNDGKPIFNIKQEYVPILKDNANPVIYHEFTHILDNNRLLPEIDLEIKTPFIKMYSEYHATQVQMKTALHYESYNDNSKFKLDDKTFDWFKSRTVQEDIVFKTQDFIATIKDILNKKRKGYVYFLLLHCIYYQSMCDFWKNYCVNDVTHLLREDIFEILFGSEFDIYHHILTKIQDRDDNYFKVLYLSQQKIAKYFVLHEDGIMNKLQL